MARCTSSPRSLRKSIVLIIAASCVIAPLTAFGETMTFSQTADQPQAGSNRIKYASYNKASLGLDQEGNVMVTYGDLSATVECDARGLREDSSLTERAAKDADVAKMASIAVRISVKF